MKKKMPPKRLKKLKAKLPKPRMPKAERLYKIIGSEKKTWAERFSAIYDLRDADKPEKGMPLMRKLLKDKKLMADPFLKRSTYNALSNMEPFPLHFELLEELTSLSFKKIKGEKPQREMHEMFLKSIYRKSFSALSDLGAKGDARAVWLLTRTLEPERGVPKKLRVDAFSALESLLLKTPKDKELHKKLELLRERFKGHGQKLVWSRPLLELAVVMLPKIRRQCPTSKNDRKGMDYLRRLVDQAMDQGPIYVVKALGFDKVKK